MSQKKRLLGHRQQRYKSNAENPIEINPDQNSATYSQHIDANVIVEKDDNQEDAGKATSADSQSSGKEVHVEKDDNQEDAGKTAPERNQQDAVQIQIVPADNQQIIVQNAPRNNQQDEDKNAPRNNPQDEDREIRDMEEFISKATDFAYFEVERKGKCKGSEHKDYKHHFLTFSKIGNHINIVFYERTRFGYFSLRSKPYDLEEDALNQHVNFKEDVCRVKNYPALENQCVENIKNIIENLGNIVDESTDNNIRLVGEIHSIQDALKRMRKAEKDCARYFPLSILKSIGFFITLVISIIAVAYCSNIQQAHVRIFIAMYSHFEYEQNDQMNDFQKCTDDYGKRVIDATRDRISLVVNKDYRHGDPLAVELMENITKSLNTKFVCDIASAYGHENILKTSISLLVIWAILQSAFIVIYDHEHLKSTVLDDNEIRKRIYLRSLSIEIIAGFVPMVISFGIGLILQHWMLQPTVAYVFCVCLSAAVTRIIVVLLLQICYNCCCKCTCNCYSHKKFSGCCCVLFTILVVFFMIFYIICILFHFLWPQIFDIM